MQVSKRFLYMPRFAFIKGLEDGASAAQGEGRLTYYRRLFDGMWGAWGGARQHEQVGGAARSAVRGLLPHYLRDGARVPQRASDAHQRVNYMITEEATRLVETSRLNVEVIARAWGEIRFKKRIEDAKRQISLRLSDRRN